MHCLGRRTDVAPGARGRQLYKPRNIRAGFRADVAETREIQGLTRGVERFTA